MRRAILPLLGLGGLLCAAADAQSLRVTPEVAVEVRGFAEPPRFEDQFETFQGGLILSGDLRWTSEDRKTRVLFEPYLRLDTEDDERSYADIREASVAVRRGEWDILFGISRVFWGVAESRNVVDVINPFDAVEDFDDGEKLGQPMLRVSRRLGAGTIEAFYLPYFRERPFPGEKGRLRFDPAVDLGAATFERDGAEWAGDVALRLTRRRGAFDLGLHAFFGTSREPFLSPDASSDALLPFYQERRQGGLDLQFTRGPWLWKLEAAAVAVGGDRFVSSVGGFEYTFFGVAGRGLDLGLIGEYLYDGRDQALAPITIFQDDAFAGIRLTFNDTRDTELIAGAIVDMENAAAIASLELRRRIGATSLLEIEVRSIRGGDDPLVAQFRNDSHLTVRWTHYF